MTEKPQGAPRKAVMMSLRITRETRAALDAEAQRTGLPVSRVAELWLTAGESAAVATVGGVGAALSALASFALRVKAEVGDPETDLIAREALLAGWGALISSALPYVPDSPEGVHLRKLMDDMGHAGAAFSRSARDAGDLSEEEVAWFTAEIPVTRSRNALASFAPRTLNRPFVDALMDAVQGHMSDAQAVIAHLDQAPASLSRLSPSPRALAATLQDYAEANAIYQNRRAEAWLKGRQLATGAVAAR